MKKFITFIIITIFINITFPAKVWAQESLSLSVYPPIVEIITKPDQTITQIYKIGNNSAKDIELAVQIVPFKANGENGTVQLVLDKGTPDRVINWFSLTNLDIVLNQAFVLKKGEEKELNLKIDVPPDASYKDYYYALLIKANPQVFTQGPTRTLISGALGSLIILSVADNNRQNLELDIAQFGLNKHFLSNIVDSSQVIGFKTVFKNAGKYYAKTEGQITVTGVFGQTDTKLALLPINVLAFSSRVAICTDSPNCELSRKVLFGHFQAKLTLTSQGQKKERTFYFYVLPIKLTGLAILAIVLVIISLKLIRIYIKRYIKR